MIVAEVSVPRDILDTEHPLYPVALTALSAILSFGTLAVHRTGVSLTTIGVGTVYLGTVATVVDIALADNPMLRDTIVPLTQGALAIFLGQLHEAFPDKDPDDIELGNMAPTA
jgi:hypothetical protein